MTFLQALLLGILQGITEFLPVSSSGHLVLAQHLLGLRDLSSYVAFNLACHLGTLLAVFIVFWQELCSLATGKDSRLKLLILALLPLAPLYFFLKPISAVFGTPETLGYFFLITATFLLLGERISKSAWSKEHHYSPSRQAFIIGLFQALAIFPGLSRSGSTLSAAQALGWKRQDAFSFSFLLAVPTILGGVALHAKGMWQGDLANLSLPWTYYGTGFLSAFLIGWVTLKKMLTFVQVHSFIPFAWYCLALGTSLVLYHIVLRTYPLAG